MLSLARTNTSLLGQWWWTIDRWLLLSLVSLILLGIFLIMAASPAVADQHHWSSFHFIKKHLLFLVPTFAMLIGVSLLSLQNIKWFALGILALSFIGLVFTLFMGIEIKGASRWINFGGISLQPSEFVKPSLVVVCAWLFANQKSDASFPGNLISLGLYLCVVSFLLLQPDLGMTALVTVVWFVQFFLAGMPLFWIFFGLAIGVCGLFGSYFLFSHVARRVDHFLNPDVGDKFGDRYQINQSLEAFLNGGFLGKGPGEGTVKKFLPDAHADFIFAVAGEEFGMVLCVGLVLIFAFILLRCFFRLFEENNMFVVLASSGLLVQFGLQAIINMASTLNLIPTKGMTLPFISYGGSSMVAQAVGMGMVLGLMRRRIGEYE
ncbi:MAG: putative peptidoglycan glycosyltransferase FtsW [Alphaproteobacteria bacterium]|nr:putative peptidoglycan glycosyltransferase FtsW [Alphaproteobacteria bacterium]